MLKMAVYSIVKRLNVEARRQAKDITYNTAVALSTLYQI